MRPTFFKRSALVLVLSSFPPILIAQTTAQPKPGDGSKQSSSPDYCQGADQVKDCRDTFEGTFYSGLGIDNFAASELNKYFDPGDASKIKLRAVGGFDFAYRLYGSNHTGDALGGKVEAGEDRPKKSATDLESAFSWSNQVWVYGGTVHGMRSAQVDCKNNPDVPTCSGLSINNPGGQTLYLLRNASSLEAYTGFRYEFATLQGESASPANLYLRSEAGFLTVAGAGTLKGDLTDVALGLVATSGRFHESYLDVGYGRSDLFINHRTSRLKINGYLTWSAFDKSQHTLLSGMRPFVEMRVDTDVSHNGSASVQTYVGVNFDVCLLFSFWGCPGSTVGKATAKGPSSTSSGAQH